MATMCVCPSPLPATTLMYFLYINRYVYTLYAISSLYTGKTLHDGSKTVGELGMKQGSKVLLLGRKV